MNRPLSYRLSHQEPNVAAQYERMYQGFDHARATERFSFARWLIEQEEIKNFLASHPSLTQGNYLDFACGTGRWLSVLESEFRQSDGIDVSDEMLNLARQKCKKSRLVCDDITSSHCLVDNSYSLATAFRFFLRAENSMRRAVLKELNRVLVDDGVLIFNIHDSKASLNWPLYAFSAITGKESPISSSYDLGSRPSLPYDEVRSLVESQGFRIEATSALGIVPNYVYALPLMTKISFSIDRFLYRKRWCNAFAIERIYYCRKA